MTMAAVIKLPSQPTDDAMLAGVDAWVAALAAGDYARAFAATEHDPYYQWSPELMRKVIEGYGLPEPHPCGEVFHVTLPQSATGRPSERVVERGTPGGAVLADIRQSLPLNGEWSDLTATFRFEPRSGYAVLVLEEIHVF